MTWNFNDNAPIYLQIVNTLKRNIASGAYPPGSRLPSVRDLALEAGVNPNTMQTAIEMREIAEPYIRRRALSELERSGLVNSQRTAGRFITEDASALLDLRKSMSEEIVSEFIARLRGIGMSDEQILETVREKINSEHKEEP